MKTFTIAISGTFEAESEAEVAEIIGRVEAAGRLALNALPDKASRTGTLVYGVPQRDGYHQRQEWVSVNLVAGTVPPVVAPAPPADVTDVPAGS